MNHKKLAGAARVVHETTPIIGLCGYGQVGKDWIASHILQAYPMAVRVSFAEPMREDLAACKARYDHMWQKLNDTTDNAPKEIIRPIYVTHGTVVGNAIHPEFWLHVAKPTIDQHLTDGALIIITDVRRRCEVDMILRKGGIVININRCGYGPAHITEALSIAEIRSCYDLPTVDNEGSGDLTTVYDVLDRAAVRWARKRSDARQSERAWDMLRESMKANYGGLLW